MNRRNAIGNMVIFSIGATVFPSCRQSNEGRVQLKNIAISGSEEKMLAQLADTIIPKNKFIGAADVKAHEFTLMMVDDCYDPVQQNQFINGLKEFVKFTRSKFEKDFSTLNPAQKKEWLTGMENKKDIPTDVLFFYETTKKYTVQAFTSSGKYMTDILKYKMVPGSNFKGCVPVKRA